MSLEPIAVGMANALAIAGRKDKNIIQDPSNLKKTVDVPDSELLNATAVDPKTYKKVTDETDTDLGADDTDTDPDTDTDLDNDTDLDTDTDLDADTDLDTDTDSAPYKKGA